MASDTARGGTGGNNERLARELEALRHSVGADVNEVAKLSAGDLTVNTVRNIEAGKNAYERSVEGYVRACERAAREKNVETVQHQFNIGYWLQLRKYGDATPAFADWVAEQTATARPAGSGRAARPPGVGWPLEQVSDPFGGGVDVHRSITVDAARETSPLTPYVRRAHDEVLAELVEAARGGRSGMAVLVAGSSAGKTRALWEALARLREDGGWRWWHPEESATPEAVRAFEAVTPRTVVWLNESQNYLTDTVSGDPQQLARRLRDLLADTSRAPVLVLGTLWDEHYTALRRDHTRPAAKLVEAAKILVPDSFDGADLAAMRAAAAEDPRLREAVEHAVDGQITQYLAGGPELIARYEHGTAAMRAVIEVAMDAVRLGHRNRLPFLLLHDAAPYYMSDKAWNACADNWFEQALAELGEPCKGAQGPITALVDRPDPSHGGRPRPGVDSGRPSADRLYYLTDYLAQYGPRLRRDIVPPIGFWEAATAYAHPDDHRTLADAAWGRGLYRNAARLWKSAVTHGHTAAAHRLVTRLRTVLPEDWRPATWAAAHVALDDPGGLGMLLMALREVDAVDQVEVLLARDPAAHVALDDPFGVSTVLMALREVGADGQAAVLAARAAAEIAPDDLSRVGMLLRELRAVSADGQMATRAAAEVALDDPFGVGTLLRALQEVDADTEVEVLLARDPAAHVALDDPFGVSTVLMALRELGLMASQNLSADEQVAVLLARDPAAEVAVDDPGGLGMLLMALREVGADGQVAVLAARAAAEVALEDLGGVGMLLMKLREVGADGQVAVLAARAAAEVALDDPHRVGWLLMELREVGAVEQVAVLLARDPAAEVAVDDPGGLGMLLMELRALDAVDQVEVLLARDPATRVALEDPHRVGWLLRELRAVGADGQVAVLLARDPATEVTLEGSSGVDMLLEEMRAVGAHDQADRLIDRLSTGGRFESFLRERPEHAERFRFGREPDGAPTAPWSWDDLETSQSWDDLETSQ
ncbi:MULTISPECIES: hypothetical protein [unclassified Nocardia]|uniref:hypothetical protein n=1 Tax=unclassified Nocardia TaxID=2637762 RepID=UPI00278C487F|nr:MULTISPECIES: hypothetical protein [unclassified Nocardia]